MIDICLPDPVITGPVLDEVRAVLRAVAAGEPVDNAFAAAQAARALAALPPAVPAQGRQTA